MAKKTVSSFLSADFGVEDLISGRFSSSPNMKDYDVLNKLGILAPLKDRNNTDPTSFALESASLLAESESFGVYATQQLNELNNRFALCNRIKRTYGIEGFDPYAVGMEGIGESMKKIGSAIVAAFKKLGAMIMNFIRSVGNAIGSAVALTQVKLYENMKGKSIDASKGKTIKARLNTIKMVTVFSELESFCTKALGIFQDANSRTNDLISGATIQSDATGSLTKKISSSLSTAMKSVLKTGNEEFGSVKPKSVVTKIIYGVDSKQDAKEYKAGEYLSKIPDGIEILSKQYLENSKKMIKVSQLILKEVNFSLKQVDKYMKVYQSYYSGSNVGSKELGKENKKAVKAARDALNVSNFKRFGVTKIQSMLLIAFGEFLKLRGYAAAAVRNYEKTDK